MIRRSFIGSVIASVLAAFGLRAKATVPATGKPTKEYVMGMIRTCYDTSPCPTCKRTHPVCRYCGRAQGKPHTAKCDLIVVLSSLPRMRP